MKKKKVKARNPFAKSLESSLFKQRVVDSKKKKIRKFNWKSKKDMNENCLRYKIEFEF